MPKPKKLSQESFGRAAEFIRKHARPLDRARFEFHFGEGRVEQVVEELVQFQNPDGGFGNAIEPDIRMPSSSALFTSVGFQTAREIELGADNAIVRQGIEYITRNFSEELGGWEPNPPEVQNYPRAQWWEYEPVDGGLGTMRVLNPGAELLGYLLDYSELTDERIIDAATESVLSTIESHLHDPEFHALLCVGRLFSTADFLVDDDLEPKFKDAVHSICEEGSTSWESYGAKPLWFANSPASYLGAELKDLCERQLLFELDHQQVDGSWIPNWAWGRYESEWGQAKNEWAGFLTVQNLIAFRNWNWLEN